jgi:hypothetical protein
MRPKGLDRAEYAASSGEGGRNAATRGSGRSPASDARKSGVDFFQNGPKILTTFHSSLVRRGVCARHKPLPRNVERYQGVDQMRPA